MKKTYHDKGARRNKPKTSRRLPYTPSSQIRNMLNKLFLHSREHQAAQKRDKNTCQDCGRKKSMAKGREVKVQVHHLREKARYFKSIEKLIRKSWLCNEDYLVTLCPECHDKRHQDIDK